MFRFFRHSWDSKILSSKLVFCLSFVLYNQADQIEDEDTMNIKTNQIQECTGRTSPQTSFCSLVIPCYCSNQSKVALIFKLPFSSIFLLTFIFLSIKNKVCHMNRQYLLDDLFQKDQVIFFKNVRRRNTICV